MIVTMLVAYTVEVVYSSGPAVVVGTGVYVGLPGHQVVYLVIMSVVTCPTGQLVTVGAHEVTVYTEVVIMVEVRVGYEVGAVMEELL